MPATATKEKKTCFVITPIGDANSDIRRHIDGIIDEAIEPALGDKYKIEAAHRKHEIGSINDKVIKNVYEANLVIANLTTTNPNVMYELAIRHSFGKPAIVIAEEGTKLPFDVVDENTIFYRNDPTGANELKQKLVEYEKLIDLEKKAYGPVYKVISKIPLYNEVEYGKDVSSEKVLQYVIDRLDSLERNINFKIKTTSVKSLDWDGCLKLSITFKKVEMFTDEEAEDILEIFIKYGIYEFDAKKAGNIFKVKFDVPVDSIVSIVSDVTEFVNMKENLSCKWDVV